MATSTFTCDCCGTSPDCTCAGRTTWPTTLFWSGTWLSTECFFSTIAPQPVVLTYSAGLSSGSTKAYTGSSSSSLVGSTINWVVSFVCNSTGGCNNYTCTVIGTPTGFSCPGSVPASYANMAPTEGFTCSCDPISMSFENVPDSGASGANLSSCLCGFFAPANNNTFVFTE